MDTLLFQERLLNAVMMRCKIPFIILIIIVALLILDVIYKKKMKTNCGISLIKLLTKNKYFTPRLTLKQQIISKTIGVAIISIFICTQVVATHNDIHNCQYMELYVHGIQDIESEGNVFSCGRMCVMDSNGKQLFLNLPADFTEEDYPIGVAGTVWYAKETKVVLAFTPASQE